MSVMRCVAVVAFMRTAGLAFGQSADPPRFEVASVRESSPSNNGLRPPMRKGDGRVGYYNLSPRLLVQIAYGAPEWRISGGPKWFESDRYDVEAKFPPNSSDDQVDQMLRTLLAERFHLMMDHESRTISVYALTVAKGGPKLKPGQTTEQWAGAVMNGGIFRGRLVLHQVSAAGLADALAGQVGRPVIDRTQLSGTFDVSLKWAPTDISVGNPDGDGPSLYTAITEQLGLKLEPTRAPVDVIVISHIEKPSGN